MAECSAACLNFKKLSRKQLQVISSSKHELEIQVPPGPTLTAELALPRLPGLCHTAPTRFALRLKLLQRMQGQRKQITINPV